MSTINEELTRQADAQLALFNRKLMPVTQREILGVKVPDLRKMARQIVRTDDWQDWFYHVTDNDSFEEIMLRGMVLGYAHLDIDELLCGIRFYVPLIDEWALCDCATATWKQLVKYPDKAFELITPYLNSDNEFEQRFAYTNFTGSFLHVNLYRTCIGSLWQFGAAWLLCADGAVVGLVGMLCEVSRTYRPVASERQTDYRMQTQGHSENHGIAPLYSRDASARIAYPTDIKKESLMKKIVFLLLMLSLTTGVVAQQLKKTLQYVPLDSVMVLPYYDTQRLTRAFAHDTTQHLRTFQTPRMGGRAFRKALKNWNLRVRDSLNLVGGVGDESYGRLQFEPARQTVEQGAALFKETADASFMDAVEAALYNSVEAALTGYFSPQYTMAAARMVFAAYSLRYATDDEGVYINLFSNSTARITTGGFRMVIDQITSMPYQNRVVVRVMHCSADRPLKIRVRLPMWAAGRCLSDRYRQLNPEQLPEMYVNGHATAYEVEKGYAVIQRKWNNGDEIYWDFNLAPRMVAQEGRTGSVAVQWGPLVYAAGVDLATGQLVAADSLSPDYQASFMRLMGPAVPTGQQKAQPLMFLPYAESFTWRGYTSVWVPAGNPVAKTGVK